MLSKVRLAVVGMLASLVGSVAMAQTTAATGSPAIDVSGVTATIGNQATSITLVGGAILGIVTLVAAIMWVRRPIH